MGEATQQSLLSRNAEAYTKAELVWHPSTAVSAIDRVERRHTLANCSHFTYGKLTHQPVGNGLAVDEFCLTSDPDIYAIGDCVEFPLP